EERVRAFRIEVPGLEAASTVDTTRVNAGAQACTVERLSPGAEPWLAERGGVSGLYFVFFLAREATDHPLASFLTAQRAAERFPSYKNWSGDFQHGRVCFAQNVLPLTGELANVEQLLPRFGLAPLDGEPARIPGRSDCADVSARHRGRALYPWGDQARPVGLD